MHIHKGDHPHSPYRPPSVPPKNPSEFLHHANDDPTLALGVCDVGFVRGCVDRLVVVHIPLARSRG